LLAIACILRWVWANDLPMNQEEADIGAGIRVPAYASGPNSHSWWAVIVLLTVAFMIFSLLAFSYVFIWSRVPETWPTDTNLTVFFLCAGLCLAAGGGVIAARVFYR